MNEELNATYIDILTGHLHRTLNSLILMEANYTLIERESTNKNGIIDTLNNQTQLLLEKIKELENEVLGKNVVVDGWRVKHESLTQEHETLKNEMNIAYRNLGQIDILSKQIDLKSTEIENNIKIIESLKLKIEEYKNKNNEPTLIIPEEIKKTTKKK